MPKLPVYFAFFEPIVFAAFFSLVPEFEYYMYPSNTKYIGPMLYLSIAIWLVCLIVFAWPFSYLIKSNFSFEKAAESFWKKRLSKRNPDSNSEVLANYYKLPTMSQFILPLVLVSAGIIWSLWPTLNGINRLYPFGLILVTSAYGIVSRLIKYNNLRSNKEQNES